MKIGNTLFCVLGIVGLAACGQNPSGTALPTAAVPAAVSGSGSAPLKGHDTTNPSADFVDGYWQVDSTNPQSLFKGAWVGTSARERWYEFDSSSNSGRFITQNGSKTLWISVSFSIQVTRTSNVALPLTASSADTIGTVALSNFQTPVCSTSGNAGSYSAANCAGNNFVVPSPFTYNVVMTAPTLVPSPGLNVYAYSSVKLTSQGATDSLFDIAASAGNSSVGPGPGASQIILK